MRKNFQAKAISFPQPVHIVGTYDENDHANAMNAAWAGISGSKEISLCLSAKHKTTKNIKIQKAFTVSMATKDQLVACDYVGIASGNKVSDKIERSGLTVIEARDVHAPLFEELPLALECSLTAIDEERGIVRGKIENISVDEGILTGDGRIDIEKLVPISFDPTSLSYFSLGERVGRAFKDGKSLE